MPSISGRKPSFLLGPASDMEARDRGGCHFTRQPCHWNFLLCNAPESPDRGISVRERPGFRPARSSHRAEDVGRHPTQRRPQVFNYIGKNSKVQRTPAVARSMASRSAPTSFPSEPFCRNLLVAASRYSPPLPSLGFTNPTSDNFAGVAVPFG